MFAGGGGGGGEDDDIIGEGVCIGVAYIYIYKCMFCTGN